MRLWSKRCVFSPHWYPLVERIVQSAVFSIVECLLHVQSCLDNHLYYCRRGLAYCILWRSLRRSRSRVTFSHFRTLWWRFHSSSGNVPSHYVRHFPLLWNNQIPLKFLPKWEVTYVYFFLNFAQITQPNEVGLNFCTIVDKQCRGFQNLVII